MSRTARFAAALLLAAPSSAAAHTMLEGVGAFYAGLLHPIAVPGEALALVAAALLLGSSGREACRVGLPAVAASLVAGLALGRHVPPTLATPMLLAVAFLAAAIVTAGARLLPPAAAGIAALAGAAVGIDAQPDRSALLQSFAIGAATLIGAIALVAIVAGLILDRKPGWPHVAVRAAASWITACAILYFVWLGTSAPT